jgi:superfamily II DNA or RNA helicase
MVSSPSVDPFILDNNELRILASDRVVRRGIAYFKESRVSDLRSDHDRLRAFVQGSADLRYYVEVDVDGDGEICVECTCPFEWEPACKHAIATLLAYAAQRPLSHKVVQGAADKALERRVKRGQTEVAVTHVGGDRWFGTWEARSTSRYNSRHKSYRVQIRSVSERINYCTCPDLDANMLGTCKHIEAVLHGLRKKAPSKFKRLSGKPPPIPVIYLSWEGPEGPCIRLKRPLKLAADLVDLLTEHFDSTGLLKGPVPEAFYKLEEALSGRTDLHFGDDSRIHAGRQADKANRKARADRILQEIRSNDGQVRGLDARLYPYQVEGVAFLASRGRALLADDMGLGKTLQAIGACHWLMQNEDVKRALIVCPASLKQQWAREIERFTGLKAQIIQGNAADRAAQYQTHNPYSLINYELVVRDKATITLSLAPDVLVIDEAQRIRNWRTKTAEAIKSVQSRYAFVLTGTPLENRLEDLYSVMQVVDHGVLGPLWRYLLDFHVTDERGRVLGYRNLSELRRRLGHAMLRRDRRLVRDQLPDRIEHRRDVELSKKQREYHDKALGTIGMYADIRKRRALTPAEQKRLLGAIQMARMACNAAGLVDKESRGSPKLDELKRILEELCLESGQKVVVFSEWERMTAMAEEVAQGLGLGTVRLFGRVPTKDRGELIESFQSNAATRVFLSTDAGGVGLNLQAGSVLINLDVPWNPAVLEQRIARVHRLGQKKTVQIIHLHSLDSYEERVAAVMAKKRELFENVISEDASQDAVGVSPKMADILLDEKLGVTAPKQESQAPVEPPQELKKGSQRPAAVTDSDDDRLSPYIEKIQRSLGSRLQQVMLVGENLVAVVDRMDYRAERLQQQRDEGVSILVVDQRTAATLDQMGQGGVFGETRELFDKSSPGADKGLKSLALIARAKRKIAAAELLVESLRHGEAIHFLAESMLSALAYHVGFPKAPRVADAAVWIYHTANKALSDEQKIQIGRALNLMTAEKIPDQLIQTILIDARAICDEAEG